MHRSRKPRGPVTLSFGVLRELATDMYTLRSLEWPADRASVLAVDTTFTTDRVYRLVPTDRSFVLEVESAIPPVRKEYHLENELDRQFAFDGAQVACDSEGIIGFAAVDIEGWNRRAVLRHLYVAPAARGRGVGRSLVSKALLAADPHRARCLWVETQTTNYPAIQFYKRLGFTWCGLDTTLYDPSGAGEGEIGLYFARPIS